MVSWGLKTDCLFRKSRHLTQKCVTFVTFVTLLWKQRSVTTLFVTLCKLLRVTALLYTTLFRRENPIARDRIFLFLLSRIYSLPEVYWQARSANGTTWNHLELFGTPSGLLEQLQASGTPAGLSAATRVSHVYVCAMVTLWECDERAMILNCGAKVVQNFE